MYWVIAGLLVLSGIMCTLAVALPPASHSRKVLAKPWKPNTLWEREANQYHADLARVQVWDAFSDMFLDTSFGETELEWLAQIIAASPFSMEELGHIVCIEVAPVCVNNLFEWPGGEWAGFSPDWLIPRCLTQQRLNPFRSRGRPDKVPFYVHALALGPCCDAYYLLFRVQRMRTTQLA